MQFQDDQFLPPQLTCRVWKSSANLPHDSLTRGNHLSQHWLHIDQGHCLTFRKKWPLTTCIRPKCATGPGNANSPLLKYVRGLLGSGPREAMEVLGASERGKGWWGGGKWGVGAWQGGSTRKAAPGVRWAGWAPLGADESAAQSHQVNKEWGTHAQTPTSPWTQTSPPPGHPLECPLLSIPLIKGMEGNRTKCREEVKGKWISLSEERLIESKFSPERQPWVTYYIFKDF